MIDVAPLVYVLDLLFRLVVGVIGIFLMVWGVLRMKRAVLGFREAWRMYRDGL